MPKRVLIADDSFIVRRLIRMLLESRLDLEMCAEAAQGLEAVEIAREIKPDLIVLDLCMPRMNGLEAAAALRGILPKVPIILFTLHKDIVSERLLKSLGISAVISKTDQLEVLISEAQKLLGTARSASA